MRSIALAMIAMGLATSHAAATKSKKMGDRHVQLMMQELEANNSCRSERDKERAKEACQRRQEYGRQLNELGWCLGRQREPAYMMTWHRCEKYSNRFAN